MACGGKTAAPFRFPRGEVSGGEDEEVRGFAGVVTRAGQIGGQDYRRLMVAATDLGGDRRLRTGVAQQRANTR